MLTKKRKLVRNNNKTKKLALIKQQGGAMPPVNQDIIDYTEEKFKHFENHYNIRVEVRLGEIYKSNADYPIELRTDGRLLLVPTTTETTPDAILRNTLTNMQSIYNIGKDTTKLNNNSLICYSRINGKIGAGFSRVPMNTIVCFLSPLDTKIHYNYDNPELNFLNMMHQLTEGQYKSLFQYRCMVRYSDSETIQSDRTHLPSVYYSCFKNSYWYYPSQLFPNMNYEIDESKFKSRSFYRTLVGTNITRPEVNHDVLQPGNNKKIINIIRCHSRPEDYRLIIIHSSRDFRSNPMVDYKTVLDLEMITYHMNRKFDNKNVGQALFDTQIRTKCGFTDYETENIIHYNSKTFSDFKYLDININLNGFTPSLQDIDSTIPHYIANSPLGARYKPPSFISKNDARYISSLSPRLIIAFLYKTLRKYPMEKIRVITCFQNMEHGLRRSLTNLYEYITKSMDFLCYFQGITEQEKMFEAIQDICQFIHEDDSLYRNIQLHRIKSIVKKISKSSPFGDLMMQQKGGEFMKIKSSEIRSLNYLPRGNIKSLYLIVDSGDYDFTTFNNLESLTIEYKNQSSAFPYPILLNKLSYLKLVNGNFGLDKIKAQCPRLQTLILEKQTEILQREHLPDNLCKLVIRDIGIDNINIFNQLTKLESLEISQIPIPIQINNSRIKHLILEKTINEVLITYNLETLELTDLDFRGGRLILPNKIKTLRLTGSNFSADDTLKSPTEVENLYVSGCQTHFDNIEKIVQCSKNLKILNLRNCEIGRKNIYNLSDKNKLEELRISNCTLPTKSNINLINLPKSRLKHLVLILYNNPNLDIDPDILKYHKFKKKALQQA